jgi:hypothetical protein
MLNFLSTLIFSFQLRIIFYQVLIFSFHLRDHPSIADFRALANKSFTLFFGYLLVLNILLLLISFLQQSYFLHYIGLIAFVHALLGLVLVPLMKFFSNRDMGKAFSFCHMVSLYITLYLAISSMVGLYQILFHLNA